MLWRGKKGSHSKEESPLCSISRPLQAKWGNSHFRVEELGMTFSFSRMFLNIIALSFFNTNSGKQLKHFQNQLCEAELRQHEAMGFFCLAESIRKKANADPGAPRMCTVM